MWRLRVLLRAAPVLLLDELTAFMDAKTKQTLFRLLQRRSVDVTVLTVTHDPDMVARCSHTVTL